MYNEDIRNNSKNKSIGKKTISYNTHKKRTRAVAISTALATVLSMSVISSVKDMTKDLMNEISVNNSISDMVSTDKTGSDLVSKYSYIVDRSTGDYAYDTYGLSKEVLKISPTYFDLVIYDIYNNMIYKNRNLDELFIDININLDSIIETNPEVYYKMRDVKSFEDYLKKLRLVDKEGNVSIEKYEEYGNFLNETYKNVIKEESRGRVY